MEDLNKDVRLIRRNLAKGFISKDAIDKMLSKLPDVTEQAEWIVPTVEDAAETQA